MMFMMEALLLQLVVERQGWCQIHRRVSGKSSWTRFIQQSIFGRRLHPPVLASRCGEKASGGGRGDVFDTYIQFLRVSLRTKKNNQELTPGFAVIAQLEVAMDLLYY